MFTSSLAPLNPPFQLQEPIGSQLKPLGSQPKTQPKELALDTSQTQIVQWQLEAQAAWRKQNSDLFYLMLKLPL